MPSFPDSRREHDVLVIGGGPAGSTCARFAQRHGLNVAVVERTGKRSVKRTSAGIFDHTWRALELSPHQYPYPIRSPNASEFRTLNNDKELTTAFNTFVDKLNRYVYFPIRDEFDIWLLSLAQRDGCVVIQNQFVRPGDIEFDNKRYLVRVGNEIHTAKFLVGAAGTGCPVYRRFFDKTTQWPGYTMFLTEVETPEQEYSGPSYVSYFNFMGSGVFGWTYVVGDGRLHIGTAHLSTSAKLKKKDMLFDEFVDFIRSKGQLAADFEPEHHHTSGGSIRMFADRPMVTQGGSCFVIGDAAGLLQCDAYNGISNAIFSGRYCADAILQGETSANIRKNLNRYLFQDVLRDMIGNVVPALRYRRPFLPVV